MRKALMLFLLYIGFIGIIDAQTKEYEINEAILSDSGILIMLEKVLQFEEDCSYYNDSLFYKVDIYEIDSVNDSIIIKFEPDDDVRSFFYYKKPIAFMRYQSHKLFFFSIINQNEVFTLSNRFETFIIDDKYEVFINDRWNQYYFGIVRDKFLYLGSVRNCSN
jgi:hypothetical protein